MHCNSIYIHVLTLYHYIFFNIKKIIFCLLLILWKSHFHAEFNFTFIYVKIPTLVNLIATFVPCTRTCMSFNVYVCIPHAHYNSVKTWFLDLWCRRLHLAVFRIQQVWRAVVRWGLHQRGQGHCLEQWGQRLPVQVTCQVRGIALWMWLVVQCSCTVYSHLIDTVCSI